MIPVIDIYRRYYTERIAWFLTWTMYVAMSAAGLGVEVLFRAVGWVPTARHAIITEAHISWNYTTVLNLVFLAVAVLLVWRAATTGGFTMVRLMNMPSTKATGRDGMPRHKHR